MEAQRKREQTTERQVEESRMQKEDVRIQTKWDSAIYC